MVYKKIELTRKVRFKQINRDFTLFECVPTF